MNILRPMFYGTRHLHPARFLTRAFSATAKMTWHRIDIPITELCIDTTLRSGQSFRWRQSAPGEFSCAVHGRLYTLKQDATTLYYKASLPPAITNETISRAEEPSTPRTDSDQEEVELKETRQYLKHYLNLKPNLASLYASWSEQDKNFAKKAPRFHGVRILKQDAWEALVGFICSSCNNIKRISQMMDKLCANYGPLIGHIDGVPYYDMPSPAALINPRVEQHLRELGFGYRAAYLFHTAQMISRQPEDWLDSLRNPENPVFKGKVSSAGPMLPEGRPGYIIAHTALQELQGVGAKVADCVCLFGLGWGEAVPVDTHVWQIAQRDYGFGRGKHKSLTKATYNAVANHFRGLWGKEAGWAHSVLFTADLKTFADKLAGIVKNEVKTEDIVETLEQIVKGESENPRIKGEFDVSTPPITPRRQIKKEMISPADSSDYSQTETPEQKMKIEVKAEFEEGATSEEEDDSDEEDSSEESTEDDSGEPSEEESEEEDIKVEVKVEFKEESKAEVKRGLKRELEEEAKQVVKEEVKVPLVKSKKRRSSMLIKDEKLNAKTELSPRLVKRTRSGRNYT